MNYSDHYVAHTSKDGKRQETIPEHLEKTAELCRKFSAQFGAEEYGNVAAMFHDLGKYSKGFQNRILHNGPKVEHSAAGAFEIKEIIKDGRALPIEFCIAGHHTGLPDYGSKTDAENSPTLCGKLERQSLRDNSQYKEHLYHFDIDSLKRPNITFEKDYVGFETSFFIRMLFSCLVDADFLATEEFMSNGSVKRGTGETLDILLKKLEKYTAAKFKEPKSEINKKRTEIFNACKEAASSDKGVFTLTVPTGGGKTIASLMFALRHAVIHGMKRIIYVIPYTSIIEQNAGVFKDITGDENVLEHHSQVQYDDVEDESDEVKKKKLATENWDLPIVVTTNVQFFESLFTSRTSGCRKLHNITNSVVIFDEAQMLPTDYLIPCVRAIAELTKNYGVTSVLCTATQPSLNRLFPKDVKIREICKDTTELYNFFRRCVIQNIGKLSMSDLTERMEKEDSFLCVVNTRRKAREIYSELAAKYKNAEDSIFHLSTLMTALDRDNTLKTIRQRLADGLPCKVISTSLIEAGVDVDFPTVFREFAGLDSIIQAAGRCNREGKCSAEESFVYCFEFDGDEKKIPKYVELPLSITKLVVKDFNDLTSPEAVKYYFDNLMALRDAGQSSNLDKKDIFNRLNTCGFSFPFAEIAKDFRIIDEATKDILVPNNEKSEELARRLRNEDISRELLRKLSPYTVSVYKWQFDAMKNSGQLEIINDNLAILIDVGVYDEKTGLPMKDEGAKGVFI